MATSSSGMKYRTLGKTGYNISEISYGAWAIGGAWGSLNDEEAKAALHRSLDAGVNMIDTADIYGDGHSEKLIREVLEERRKDGKTERVFVFTKAGRGQAPHGPQNYTVEALRESINGSRERLGMKTLDLVQLHCPPPEVLEEGKVFDNLETLKKEGLIAHWGVSIETVAEAIKSIKHPGCASVQIIFNPFRQKPAEEFLPLAKKHDVGIICRVPLCSGLLTGKFTKDTKFEKDDHRNFNRKGEAFDKGETFGGLGEHLEDSAFPAVEELRKHVREGMSMAQFALKWILSFDEVTCAIPGCRTAKQVADNVAASAADRLTEEEMEAVNKIYETYIKKHVHDLW